MDNLSDVSEDNEVDSELSIQILWPSCVTSDLW